MSKKLSVWYEKGLSFQCTECGRCCTGSPGAVWVDKKEIEDIAKFLSITVEELEKTYTRMLGNRKALKEKPPKNGDFDCVFLENNRCSIYPVRPKQCKTFPWWKENLTSEEAWNEAASYCEGINKENAPVFSAEEIHDRLQ